MVRIIIILTGTLSFLYFLYPQTFDFLDTNNKDVLGIKQINAKINKSTIETALITYCLKDQKLPKNLNALYDGYLGYTIKINLDSLYKYKIIDEKNCEYSLDVG